MPVRTPAEGATHAAEVKAVEPQPPALVVPRPQKPPSLGSLTQQGNSITVKQSAASRVSIYGRAVVGGVYTYIASTGTNNEFLHLVVTFSGHEVDAIEAYYFDQYQLVLQGPPTLTLSTSVTNSGFTHERKSPRGPFGTECSRDAITLVANAR